MALLFLNKLIWSVVGPMLLGSTYTDLPALQQPPSRRPPPSRSRSMIGRIAPGSVLAVKINPAKPSNMVIDWQAVPASG